MPRYRIHRIKQTPGESFRWAAHTGGEAQVKPKDYEPGDTVEAATPYAAWKLLGESRTPLRPGDLLEVINESEAEPQPDAKPELFITKYIGFEPAAWIVPEIKRSALPALTAEPTQTC